MNIMFQRLQRAVVGCTVAMALGLACTSAQAAALRYNLVFDGSEVGPAGTGSFLWDADTLTMTSLTWSLGPDITGGVPDYILLGQPGSPSLGQAMFEVMTGQDVHPTVSPNFAVGALGGLDGTFPNGEIQFVGIEAFLNPMTYELRSANPVDPNFEIVARGMYTVTPVPLPAALWMFVSGLGVFGAMGRRTG